MSTHLKPRSTTVTLYQGDDMDQLAHLKRSADIAERQLEARLKEAAANADTARAGDDTSEEITAAQEAVDAARGVFDEFVDDAAGRALSVRLQSIGRRRFADLLAAHPPRKVEQEQEPPAEGEPPPPPKMVDHADDGAPFHVNTETFSRALLTFRDGDLVTIAQPEFGDKAAVEAFVDDELAEGDFEQLWIAAWSLNRNPSSDPKGLRYSTASVSTDET